MPLYDYKCNSCEKVFEKLVSMSSTDTIYCECGKEARKLVSTPWIHGCPDHVDYAKWNGRDWITGKKIPFYRNLRKTK